MKTVLIIVAAGKGKRLAALYYYPKILLPVYNKAIVDHIVEFWQPDETIIVCNSENEKIIKEYTNYKYIYATENRCGSAFATRTGLVFAKEIGAEKVIINWSDVIPTQKIKLEGNFIFTSSNIKCRYMGKLGGFYGIFIWNLDSVNIDICVNKEEVDLLDVLDLNNFSEIEIPAIDIGDPDKYQESLRIVDRPIRSFNKIIVGENSVTKICNDEILKNAEENWYKEMQDLKFIPRVFSYDPLILQKINGEQKFDIIKPLYKLAKKIHKSKSTISSNPNDCWNMYIYKTIKRLELIDYLFPFKDCFGVNGIFCKNPVERLKKIDITKFIPEKFTPIHGDLTTSNVLWDGRKPYIIDPRGIFGESFLYGDPDYDIAKIYYSSTGWHLLNKGALIPVIKSLNEFKINDIEKYKDDKINFLLAIIWLSVAEYVKSNTLSSLYAYLTGSYLLERWLLDNE